MKFEFLRQIFRKILRYQNFVKIRPVEAELFHAEVRADMTKLSLLAVLLARLNVPPNYVACGSRFIGQAVF